MSSFYIRFYGELNECLPSGRRQKPVKMDFYSPMTIEGIIEEMKVPSSRVDLVLSNGKPVGFNYVVAPDDWISVYPRFRTIDITPLHLIPRGRFLH